MNANRDNSAYEPFPHASSPPDEVVGVGDPGFSLVRRNLVEGLIGEGVRAVVPTGDLGSADALAQGRSLPVSRESPVPSSAMNRSPIPLAEIGRAIERCGRHRRSAKRTIEAYVEWARRFVMFNACRHPADMGICEVEVFIRDLAWQKKVAASTQNQALQALVFLYARVLQIPLPANRLRAARAKRTRALPEVLSRTQVAAFLKQLVGIPRIVAWLQYGAGLRVMEALRLRVDDIKIAEQVVMIPGRRGVWRAVPLPQIVLEPLAILLRERQQQWALDQLRTDKNNKAMIGQPGKVAIQKSPFIFTGTRARRDARTGVVMRHHVDEHYIQSSYRLAYKAAGILAPVSTLTLRHCYAVHVLERGGDVRVVQETLGQRDIRTTMLYYTVSQRGPGGVRSPADDL